LIGWSYSGPAMKVGQSITVIADPVGYAETRLPGATNPTWSLIFGTLSVTLLTGALILAALSGEARRRAQAHDAPDAILRKT
jgi:hypothetical protein